MSIWISEARRAALAGGLILSLAGCLSPGGGGTVGFLEQSLRGSAAAARVPLYQGQVVVSGPPGYCVDTKSVRRSERGQFALIAACEALSGVADLQVEPAVMTVMVLPHDAAADQPGTGQLVASLRPHEALKVIDGDGVSIVHVATGGDAGLPGGDPRHWRAVMLINGHVTGLALYGGKGSAVAGPGGRRVILDLAEALRSGSPTGATPDAAKAPAGDGAASDGPGPRGLKSIISGLFPKAG